MATADFIPNGNITGQEALDLLGYSQFSNANNDPVAKAAAQYLYRNRANVLSVRTLDISGGLTVPSASGGTVTLPSISIIDFNQFAGRPYNLAKTAINNIISRIESDPNAQSDPVIARLIAEGSAGYPIFSVLSDGGGAGVGGSTYGYGAYNDTVTTLNDDLFQNVHNIRWKADVTFVYDFIHELMHDTYHHAYLSGGDGTYITDTFNQLTLSVDDLFGAGGDLAYIAGADAANGLQEYVSTKYGINRTELKDFVDQLEYGSAQKFNEVRLKQFEIKLQQYWTGMYFEDISPELLQGLVSKGFVTYIGPQTDDPSLYAEWHSNPSYYWVTKLIGSPPDAQNIFDAATGPRAGCDLIESVGIHKGARV